MKHIVVSDLHLGMGRENDQTLHPLEDYDSDEAFERLIELTLRDGGSLIINGDWLDFLQVKPFVGVGTWTNADGLPLAYTASDAMEKLETILSRQSRHFDALQSFLAHKGRLTVIQGNHDADFFFPALGDGPPPLQARLRRRLGDAGDAQLRFLDTSLTIGRVYLEHGHQRCEHVNGFQNHPNIFHAERTRRLGPPTYMELLWGSRLVIDFFNDLEREYPFADNLKPTTRALWLGIRNGWVNGRVAGSFLRFLLGSGLPLKDFPEVLEPPPTDAPSAVRRLKDPALQELLIERMRNDSTFYAEVETELAQAPAEEQERWHASSRSEIGREEVVPQGEQGVAGLIREAREFREAGALLDREDVSAVLFGHTHFAIDGNAGDAKLSGYFNTGTWIPSLDLTNPEIKRRLKEEDFPVELLKDRSIFQRRLTYAVITETAEGGSVELKEM